MTVTLDAAVCPTAARSRSTRATGRPSPPGAGPDVAAEVPRRPGRGRRPATRRCWAARPHHFAGPAGCRARGAVRMAVVVLLLSRRAGLARASSIAYRSRGGRRTAAGQHRVDLHWSRPEALATGLRAARDVARFVGTTRTAAANCSTAAASSGRRRRPRPARLRSASASPPCRLSIRGVPHSRRGVGGLVGSRAAPARQLADRCRQRPSRAAAARGDRRASRTGAPSTSE